jgi:hypothetical protein
MIERGEDFGFALEAREAFGIGGHGRGKHLEGNGPFQVRVGGLVDLAHPAHADLGGNFINAETGAEGKCQCDASIPAGAECGRD